MLQEAGTQTLQTYIDRNQVTVTYWVALQPILEVCPKEMGYERGGGAPGAVLVSGGIYQTFEGHDRRDLGGREGAALTGIR